MRYSYLNVFTVIYFGIYLIWTDIQKLGVTLAAVEVICCSAFLKDNRRQFQETMYRYSCQNSLSKLEPSLTKSLDF